MVTEVSPDPPQLRRGRRERALAQMEAHDLDILVLGRQANIRYVAGCAAAVDSRDAPVRSDVCCGARDRGDLSQ